MFIIPENIYILKYTWTKNRKILIEGRLYKLPKISKRLENWMMQMYVWFDRNSSKSGQNYCALLEGSTPLCTSIYILLIKFKNKQIILFYLFFHLLIELKLIIDLKEKIKTISRFDLLSPKFADLKIEFL